MSSGKITLRNYRSFGYDNPIEIEIRDGITFILGLNNIGKSNILKSIYELSNLIGPHNYGNSTILAFNGANINYGNVKNQKSLNNEINLSFQVDETRYYFSLTPQVQDLTSNSYVAQLNKTTPGIQINREELGILYKLYSSHIYIGTFRTATFHTSGSYFGLEVGTNFINIWDQWANGTNVLNRGRISRLKEELRELFDYTIFNISVTTDKKNLLIETDDGSFNLDELGGGISHFIIVLGNALIREPDFILIDEPENALHPKMQEIFIRTLASKAKCGIIATSHSIGLARSTADRIFSMTKENGRISIEEYGNQYRPRVINSINELGYSQFVEIGGNNILLVEGRTDIKSFKEILRKYKIEQHFIIMDLGGSNFINEDSFEELNEIKRLNAKSYSVIFDSEYEKENDELKDKLKKFKANCENLNFNVFVTEYHSSDNYIHQEAINKVIGQRYTALTKYENLEKREKTNKWGKSSNWKMFREMELKDFIDTQLHKFITEKLIPLTKV